MIPIALTVAMSEGPNRIEQTDSHRSQQSHAARIIGQIDATSLEVMVTSEEYNFWCLPWTWDEPAGSFA